MPNRLASESSPYLLQHANNPVDWYPWGDEAHAKSRAEGKPIFLSIGYAACHWCHVMEHESFEDVDIAKLLNQNFVCIKVDREERPDLDQIYMHAVQMIAGRGGWPMSMFLTPDLKPFYGGTYWPPRDSRGMPGFDRILHAVLDAWRHRQEQVQETAANLTDSVRRLENWGEPEEDSLRLDTLWKAAGALERSFDHTHGGFGGAPKFPHPMDLRLLLRAWQRTGREGLLSMVTQTLEKMAAGGIYDQLGGGFHRYSVDERWLVPHFEKMLYDNALLTPCYLEAYQATGNADFATVARETLDYVLHEMTGPEGGFYSTLDADSEGEEGKFYVWTADEVRAALGEAFDRFAYVYDVTPEGNFEGHTILNRPKTWEQCAKILGQDEPTLRSEMAECRAKLLALRGPRIRPGLDDKTLLSWNGMMIEAMAMASAILDEARYVDGARRAAEFLLTSMRTGEDGLAHSYRLGTARGDAFLDDYACLASGLMALYEATFEERWIDEAARFLDYVLAHFQDPNGGGFYYTSDRHETLIARQKDALDSSVPSGNSAAATALGKLGRLTGEARFSDAAEQTLRAAATFLDQYPTGMGQMLLALDAHLGPSSELVLLADPGSIETKQALSALRRAFLPRASVTLRSMNAAGATSKLLDAQFAGKSAQTSPTLYVCSGSTCQPPVSGAEAIAAQFDKLARIAT